jgi:hypothetical protein
VRTPGHFISIVALTLASGTLPIHAQGGAQDGAKAKFVQAQQRNAAQLRQYGWTSRTELKLKGESKSIKMEAFRYDAIGQLQKKTLPTPASQQLKLKEGEKKTEEFKALIASLAKLARSYANLTPGEIQAFAQKAIISKDPATGALQLQGSSVVVTDDRLIVMLDATTQLMRSVSIDSRYNAEPVKISVAYQAVPQGPTYPAQMALTYPKKDVEVTVQNSDYQRLQNSPDLPDTDTSARPVDEGWPRQTIKDGATLVTYQPQVDEWKDFKTLTFRMAFRLTPKGGKPTVGALSIEALTDVDNDTHQVVIHDLKVQHTNFPSLDEAATTQMDQLVRGFLPPVVTVSLERIAAATPKKETVPTAQLKNDPPLIFVSYKPAILLDFDGEPVFVPNPKTTLDFVLNTSWRVFRDKTDSQYYFLAGEQWLTSANIKGPWSAATKLPADMDTAAKDEFFADLKNFVPMKPAKAGAIVPAVFYSTSPAEVILFDGQPAYKAIPGTQLSYASNTVSYVFNDTKMNRVYYLAQGRWFSSNSLDGPWTFATAALPEDFANIPESSPASQVLASVPGSEEAKDSVLMAQIPTVATVDPQAAAAAAKVTYDGEPKFEAVAGTSMQYATNTMEKVIKLGDVYYLCLQGVWFLSTTPQGPWQTAPSVPPEIYTIPPSSPIYNVTYVNQTTLPTGEVESSYTAGYVGAFAIGVGVGAVIVGGTGYYYPPYVGYYPGYYGYPYYYAAPYTYGAAAYYNSATGRYGVSQVAYGPYGAASRSASYNPYTGTATRSASVATPYGRASAGQAYNPYTGAYGATRQGSNAYSQWGSSVVSKNGRSAYTQHYSDSRGTVGSIQGSNGGAAVGGVGRNGNSAFAGKTAGGDVYAGRDGNVYRNTGSGWQKYDNGNWNSANQSQTRKQPGETSRSAPQNNAGAQRTGSQTQALQGEAQSRQRGAESSQRYQRSAGGGGFSGRSGGGRRR